MVAAGQLQPLLGVFQKLLASKALDHEGFRVLQAVYLYIPPTSLASYLPTVWQLLLQRLQSTRTPKLQRLFVGFVMLVVAKEGVGAAQDALNALQAGLFVMLLTNVRLWGVVLVVWVGGCLLMLLFGVLLVFLACECCLSMLNIS